MKIYDYKGRKNISGEKIREARIIKRLTQSDLAAQLQIAGVNVEIFIFNPITLSCQRKMIAMQLL